MKTKIDHLIKLAQKKEKQGMLDEAKSIYEEILLKYPNNLLAKKGLISLQANRTTTVKLEKDPPQEQLNSLINLLNQGQHGAALNQSILLISEFPQSAVLHNIHGAIRKKFGQLELSMEAYNKALEIRPEYAEAYSNMGITLQEQGKVEYAAWAYKKALSLKPNLASTHNNLGVTLGEQGQPKEAIKSFKNAIALNPAYAEPHNNLGNSLKELGKLEQAIEAYNEALKLNPNYAEAYNNLGNALKENNQPNEAIQSYKEALSIKPDYAEVHRNLSNMITYTRDDKQVSQVFDFLQRAVSSESDQCNLHYAYAKMQEDLGNFSVAYEHYIAGGALRKKLLSYHFSQDQNLFVKIKNTAPKFKSIALPLKRQISHPTPIFILGMPRSGTSLVEQIISSHSEVTGGGELDYVARFGSKLAYGDTNLSVQAVSEFREQYFKKIKERAQNNTFVTDKMPHNFRYLPLICTAFPEAKIIHVKRNPKAVCWSNFKQFFTAKDLGYSCDLRDTVQYFRLYHDLMCHFSESYCSRIYTLDYDELTEVQESETRKLIKHLQLKWEDGCLSPQNNKRSVNTASNLQVRRKVYQGSSQAWRKYGSLLNSAFEKLEG